MFLFKLSTNVPRALKTVQETDLMIDDNLLSLLSYLIHLDVLRETNIFSSLFGIQRISPSVTPKIFYEQVTIISRQIVEKHRGEFWNSESHITCVVSGTSKFSRNMAMIPNFPIFLSKLTVSTNMTIGGLFHGFSISTQALLVIYVVFLL